MREALVVYNLETMYTVSESGRMDYFKSEKKCNYKSVSSTDPNYRGKKNKTSAVGHCLKTKTNNKQHHFMRSNSYETN